MFGVEQGPFDREPSLVCLHDVGGEITQKNVSPSSANILSFYKGEGAGG